MPPPTMSPGSGELSLPQQVDDPAAVDAPGSSYDDPMARVLGLDSESSSTTRWLGYGLAAMALMASAAGGIRYFEILLQSTNARALRAVPQEIDVQVDAPPPPPPPPTPKEDKPEPAPPPRATPREAPPPPAQAAKVLTREPDPNEPVDLTGDTIVTGDADEFPGGLTAANGTGQTAVRGVAAPTATSAPASAPAAPPGPDRSRALKLAGGAEWNCDFPEEANAAQIDDAYVTIEVAGGPDGRPQSVRIVNDPGHGFGRLAKSCAFAQRFEPALDHDGHPVQGTKQFRVHFSR
jgi:protein TonB